MCHENSKASQIELMKQQLEGLVSRIIDMERQAEGLSRRIEMRKDRILALEAELKRYKLALTPSGETKAAYMGEITFGREIDDGNLHYTERITLPWTAMKEAMSLIRGYAAGLASTGENRPEV